MGLPIPDIEHRCERCTRITTSNCIATEVRCRGCGGPTTCYIDGAAVKFERSSPTGLRAVFRKVKGFGRGKRRAKGVWMPVLEKGKLSIYITCARCGTINDISDVRLLTEGYEEFDCFHCGNCFCDHFIALEGFWKFDRYSRKRLDQSRLFEGGHIVKWRS